MDVNLVPREIEKSILEVDYFRLKRLGFEAIYFDIDNTFLKRGEIIPQNDVIQVLRFLPYLFDTVLISNTIVRKKALRAEKIGSIVKASVVCCSFLHQKPKKWGYEEARRITGVPFEKSVMIGDQLFTDILGANRLGLHTIYVPPLGSDIWISKLTFRRFREKRILSRLVTD